jgi:hypothetical protein
MSSRTRSTSTIRRKRSPWPWLAGLIVVATVAGAVIGRAWVGDVWHDWSTRYRSIAAEIPDRVIEERTAAGDSTSVLLVVGSAPDAAFALAAVGPSGSTTLVVLPQQMLVAVPGFGEFRLIDALAFEGPERVASAVRNQFGIAVEHVLALSPGALAAALPGPLEVEVPAGLFLEGDEGVTPIVEAGRVQAEPPLVETLLVTQTEDPFDDLARQGAAWRAVIAAIATEPALADRLGGSNTAAADTLLSIAVDSERTVASIPVQRVPYTGGDALAPDATQVSPFIASRLGFLLMRDGVRPRVEVLNGSGRIGATIPVADLLVRRGFRVVRTDNADRFDYEESRIIVHRATSEADAREAAEAIGVDLVLLEARAPSSVVDISIIVGHDIPSGE